uniref:nuclear pore glycoprotein p62-like n=1 Tax=Lonchura striata TaxID=40157 RepID=UPI001293A3E0|nr:nuclear pore glycoprotein p62-like [Lonchura striata domestica]
MSQFSFGAAAPGGAFGLGAPRAAATAAAAGFSFSAPASTGFSFGSAAPAAGGGQPAGLFSFSRPGTAAQPAGFSFGSAGAAPAAPAAAAFPLGANTPKVNFGASTTTPAPGITGGFSFAAPVATSTPSSQAAAPSGFAFGSGGSSSSSTAPSGTTGGFTFSSGTTTQAGTAGFSIGTAAPQATSAGLSFGTAPAAAASTSTATLAAASPAAAPFSLGGQPTGLTFALPSTAATSTTTATTTTSTSQAPILSFGTKLGVTSTAASTASTTSTTSVLGSTGPSLFASVATSSAPASSSTSGLSLGATSTGSTGTASLGTLGFGLLKGDRAWESPHVGAGASLGAVPSLCQPGLQLWQLMLMAHSWCDCEQALQVGFDHSDLGSCVLCSYKLAENIDAQLKRMAQDLKDIIDHLNTSGGPADSSDPLQQICKILNAHMDSLQWIDQNSAVLQRKVEEVTKVCESRRKEQERSFRITFD